MSMIGRALDYCQVTKRHWIALRIPCWLPLLVVLAVGPVGHITSVSAASALPSAILPSTLVVTKLADTKDGACNSDCSLCEAIAAAGPNDIITFASGLAGTITLRDTLKISKNLTINGPGTATIVISGNNTERVFYVDAGVDLTIRNLTVARGNTKGIAGSADTPGQAGGDARGGGLYNDGGIVTIINSTFSENSVTGGAGGGDGRWGGSGLGGAVFSTGTLVVLNSTFSHNQAKGGQGSPSLEQLSGSPGGEGMGGAIFSMGTLATVNSTFSGNKAIGEYNAIGTARSGPWGGRILRSEKQSSGYGGAIFAVSDTWVSNCTLVNNTASVGGAIHRPGGLPIKNKLVMNPFGVITIKNTLIIGSSSGDNCDASIISEGYNIDSDGTCGLEATGDLSNIDPKLGPLKNNGGSTFTHALLPDSPAIDGGNPAGCTDNEGAAIPIDQRGRSRPWGERCDIGAFEFSR
jgi:CSLREA domain-containing protein